MPWKECSKEDERVEFVSLAKVEGANVRRLCERFGISRKTGHKWLRRFGSNESLTDRSRRPQHSPTRTARKMEQAVLGVRDRHPAWGGRKIAARLQNTGHQGVPAASTITEILRRHERLDETEAIKHRPYQRFERARPNDLWQMDFKGHFGLRDVAGVDKSANADARSFDDACNCSHICFLPDGDAGCDRFISLAQMGRYVLRCRGGSTGHLVDCWHG
jgi:transposase